MFNEQSIAASSSSDPVQSLTRQDPFEVLPYDILQLIMDLLPIHSQRNFKAASGTKGKDLKTTEDKLKAILSQNEPTPDDLEKAQRIITRARERLVEVTALDETLDLSKLKKFKEFCSGDGAIKIAGYEVIPDSDNMIEFAKSFLLLMCFCFAFFRLLGFVLSFFVNEADGVAFGLCLVTAIPLTFFLKDFTLKCEWKNFLNHYRELISDDEVSNLGQSVWLVDGVINKCCQFSAETTPTIQNKNQLEEQASLVCGFSSFFYRHQRIEQPSSPDSADNNENDNKLSPAPE